MNIGIFSIELFTKTAKFILRDINLKNVHFFSYKHRIPTSDFSNVEVVSVEVNLINRIFYKIIRTLKIDYRFASIKERKLLLKEFQSKKIDIAIAHFGPSGIELAWALKDLRIPIIIVFHGYDHSKLLSNRAYRNKLRELGRMDNIYVRIPAFYLKKKLETYFPKSTFFHIPYSVEVYPCINNVKSKFTFFQSSNFVLKKGHFYTLMAFSKLPANLLDNVVLKFAGSGPELNKIKSLAQKLNLKNIIFLGHITKEKIQDELNNCDCFLHHSITDINGETETVPTAIMEAMAYEKIIISTFHAGIPELITHNENGFLVKEKDIDNYAQIIQDVYKNHEQYTHIRKRARKTIEEKYSIPIVYNNYQKTLELLYEKSR